MSHPRKSVLLVLLGLIFVSFFGILAVTASMVPGYDWRYRVISSLLSPRDNPQHYQLAAFGVVISGLLMLPFAAHLYRILKKVSARAAVFAAAAFLAGVLALICDCFVVPQHAHATLGVRRLHECLARSSAGLLTVTMVTSCWCAWKGRGEVLPKPIFWIWSATTVLPLLGIFCSEGLLILARLNPNLAQPIRRALRHSVVWHLGFWEWIGAAAVFVFLCAAVMLGKPLKERMG